MEDKRILTIKDICERWGIGRELAERYARESGAVLPRIKNSPYKVRAAAFTAYMEGMR